MESFECIAERAVSARLACGRLGAAALEDVLGVPLQRLIESVEESSSSLEGADAFPSPDEDGQWEWSAVRAWVLRRNDPIPASPDAGDQGWPALRDWLLRNLPIEQQRRKAPAGLDCDKHDLTLGQRDFLERVLTARAAGLRVPAVWVEEIIVLYGNEEVSELLARISRSRQPLGQP